MSDARQIVLEAEQAYMLEDLGQELLRRNDLRATQVLAIVLAWRFSSGSGSEPEEAGLAEVVELHGYSRGVPCE